MYEHHRDFTSRFGSGFGRAAMLACVGAALCAAPVNADVPLYEVQVVSEYDATTVLRGASDVGHFVGEQTVAGFGKPFVATLETGLEFLPLPPDFTSGTALDVNDSGVVVGAVAGGGFPFDGGQPAIWTPDGSGGYDVVIPPQFKTLPSPLGELPISGGMAVAINNAGTVVGWSRFQGFQGGPSTRFFLDAAPVDLRTFGFEAEARDVSEADVVVGGQLKLDLTTETTTDIGVPDPVPGGTSFIFAIAYRINAFGDMVVAAHQATSLPDRWLTFVHDEADGYARLNPSQLATPFVGFYDNNDLGDVSATGGVLFREEGVLLPDFDSLIVPRDADWDPALGFIANDRSVVTTAFNVRTGTSALVLLRPLASDACPADLDGSGAVDVSDLLSLLASWGTPDADLDGDGSTGVADLLMVLSAWGPCPASP